MKVKLFDVKYVKNGNSYDVGPIGFTLDDLERLKVKVTNGTVTTIDMWGYTLVGLTGVLVKFEFRYLELMAVSRYCAPVGLTVYL